PAEPDRARAATARHLVVEPAADPHPGGAPRLGLGHPAAPRRPLGRRLREPAAGQARGRAAGPEADLHPQRDRLSLLARRLSRPAVPYGVLSAIRNSWAWWTGVVAAFYIFFTTPLLLGNKLLPRRCHARPKV